MPDQLEGETLTNSFQDLATGLFPTVNYQSQTIAQPWTFIEGASYTPFTLNRIGLSYGYMSYGLVQSVVDQPVEDAFRGGVEIESDELDEKDLEKLEREMHRNGDIEAIKYALKWARLYGGAGLLIVTDQDPSEPLDIEALKNGAPLKFIAADRWELVLSVISVSGSDYGFDFNKYPRPFSYYGLPLHSTRVVKLMGREAPSFIRQRLQGWGMSELERCIREINTYIKFQNLLYELVDEAKIDVYRIEQFNNSLASAQGTNLVQMRVQLGNLIKNYQNALVMDKEDEYDQKQLAFAGLADIFEQFRINLSAALKIPMPKLFGQATEGFGSGEDQLENYNAMVEADVREKCYKEVETVIGLRCMNIFGFIPSMRLKFKPLRVLGAVEEEQTNDAKFNRAMGMYDRGLLNGRETMESLHKDKLLNVQSEVLDGTREPESPMLGEQMALDGNKSEAEKKPESKMKENGLARLASMLGKRKAA